MDVLILPPPCESPATGLLGTPVVAATAPDGDLDVMLLLEPLRLGDVLRTTSDAAAAADLPVVPAALRVASASAAGAALALAVAVVSASALVADSAASFCLRETEGVGGRERERERDIGR